MNQQHKGTASTYLKYAFFFGWSILVFAYYFPSLWKGDLTGLLDYFPYRFFVQCGIIDIFLACWVILVTYAVGNFILQISHLKGIRKGENIFLSFAFGFISISFLSLFLALIGFLYSFIFYTILAGVTCLTIDRIRGLLNLLKEEVLNFYNEVSSASFWQKAFVIFLLFYFSVLFFVSFIHSLGPEIGTDPIVYRLFPLRVYAENHGLTSIPEVRGTFSVKNVQMYFLFGYMLHNEITIKVTNLILGIILCYTIYSISNRYFGRIPGLSVSVLFYSIPIVSLHTHTVLVDIGLSFFIFLSVYFMVDWICSHGGRKSLILSALFCAFAVGTKPYAIISAGALCVLMFWKLYRTDKNSGTISFLKATAFGAVSASGYLPWALIDFYFTNNPFYPYFSKYFGGPYALEQSMTPIRDYKLTIPLLPSVGITSMPIIFFKALWGISFDGNTYGGIIGPFFVLLLPILAFAGAKKLDAAIKQFLWFSLINFVLWFPLVYNVRYMMPLYPALCIATVYIFQSFLTTTSRHKLSPLNTPLNPLLIEGRREGGVFFRSFIGTLLKSLTVLIIIIFAILNLPFFYNSWQHNPKRYSSPLHTFPLSYVLGLESKEKYLERFIRSYPVVQFTNNLPNIKTILYIGGPETPFFYLKHKTADLLTYYVPNLAQLNDPEALLKALKERCISHIIRDKNYKGKLKEGIITLLQNTNIDGVFVNEYLRKMYEKNAFVLYEVLAKKKSFVNEYVHYYFLDHTVDATVLRSSNEQFKKEDYKDILEINSDKRCALKTLPPSKIQFTSTVPNDAFLTFSIGKLLPDIGDGGTFTLNLADQYGKDHDLFRKTLNPRDNYKDGGWHYNEIDLSQFRGQKVDFVFGSDGSNSLDETGDWFAWADPQIVARPRALNLIERLPEARMTPSSCEDTPNGKPAFLFPLERGGDTRNTITTVAPSEITFTVNIPAENTSLIFGLAMPYQLGDGASAEIFFEADGITECLYSRYISPAPNPPSPPFAKGGSKRGLANVGEGEINGWIDEIISLDKFAGKKAKLIFRTSPGPAGDSTADWMGWSEPRIVIVKQ